MINKQQARVLIASIDHCKSVGMDDDFIEELVANEVNKLVKNCSIPDVSNSKAVVCSLFSNKPDCVEFQIEGGKTCINCKWRKQTNC